MLLRSLADRICQVTFEALPGAAVEMAKEAILDTVGVTLAGANEETTSVVARALRKTAAAGPALIFGDTQRLDVLSAALINGVAAHALDFDDCMHGIVSLEHFSDDAVRDPAARALMARVHATPDPDAHTDTGDHFYARLRVTTTAGTTFEHFVDTPLGGDRTHPLPPGTLAAKFRDCAGLALDAVSTETLLKVCGELDTVADVAEVLNVMAAGAALRAGIEPSGGARVRAFA
jgi:2-methylcitrate dehydratase PrpD